MLVRQRLSFVNFMRSDNNDAPWASRTDKAQEPLGSAEKSPLSAASCPHAWASLTSALTVACVRVESHGWHTVRAAIKLPM